jgi:hypothetical protein
MRIDVNTYIGAYPWRRVPGTSPDAVLAAMDRAGVDEAWVSHLPGLFWKDPTEGNAFLLGVGRHERRLRPVLAVHPLLANWRDVLERARDAGAVAVRADPTFYGIEPAGAAMLALAEACGEAGVPLVTAVRLEDVRGRHPNDRADDLPPWAARRLLRAHPSLRLLVTNADRGFVEEVHFGSTPDEARRCWWDIAWIWGPPEDQLQLLLRTVGGERFVLGSGQPLRIPETPIARLDLLDLDGDGRAALEHGNAGAFAGSDR